MFVCFSSFLLTFCLLIQKTKILLLLLLDGPIIIVITVTHGFARYKYILMFLINFYLWLNLCSGAVGRHSGTVPVLSHRFCQSWLVSSGKPGEVYIFPCIFINGSETFLWSGFSVVCLSIISKRAGSFISMPISEYLLTSSCPHNHCSVGMLILFDYTRVDKCAKWFCLYLQWKDQAHLERNSASSHGIFLLTKSCK